MKTERAHHISPLIEHEWINVEKAIEESESQIPEEKEIDLLVDITKRSLDEHKSILVFADSKRSIDKICDAFREANIKSLPYYSGTDIAL